VNAFVIRSPQPVLVDTGLAGLRDSFLAALGSVIPPEEIRWIWLTHTDADHAGNLKEVLDMAPGARLVTNFLGMGKLGLLGLPTDRVHLLNPGQSLDVGDRTLVARVPPTFDAPETTGFFDPKTSTLFSADCFGALMGAPAETAADIPPNDLRDGLITWSTVDAPWLHRIDAGAFGRTLEEVRDLQAEMVLSGHLPPAFGMAETLLGHLAGAPAAQPFVGPDQAALEKMMSELAADAGASV
jgi:glyoxylase-like metal-dependent hydrolase (beta-lactamase superfamily II)